MTFSEAIKELQNGEAITHKDYNGYYQYNGNSVWYHYYDEDGQAHTGVVNTFRTTDLLRDDWEIATNCIPEPMLTNMICDVADLIEDKDGYYAKILLPYKKNYIEKFKKICFQIYPEKIDNEEHNENNDVESDSTEDKPIPRSLNFTSYCSHDCEAFYECPACGKSYTSWGFFHKGLNGGDNFECECGTLLRVPQ